jgi:hypothetical protein
MVCFLFHVYLLFSVSCLPIVSFKKSLKILMWSSKKDRQYKVAPVLLLLLQTLSMCANIVCVFLCEHGMCLSFCVNMACVCLFAWTWHVFVFLCEHGICLSFCVNIVLVSFRKIVDIKDKLIHTLRNWECSSVLRTNVSDKRNDFNFPVVIFHLCVVTFQQHLYMGYIFLHEVFFRYS